MFLQMSVDELREIIYVEMVLKNYDVDRNNIKFNVDCDRGELDGVRIGLVDKVARVEDPK